MLAIVIDLLVAKSLEHTPDSVSRDRIVAYKHTVKYYEEAQSEAFHPSAQITMSTGIGPRMPDEALADVNGRSRVTAVVSPAQEPHLQLHELGQR